MKVDLRGVLPATARQKLIIARLCMALRVRDEIEQQPMTLGEAGRLIRELSARIRVEKANA